MKKWFQCIVIGAFLMLMSSAGYSQSGCSQLPVLSEGFESGWDGWTGVITSSKGGGEPWEGQSAYQNQYYQCPASWDQGFETGFQYGISVSNASGWCLQGPGGYGNSSTSALLDMVCTESGGYIEATLTSPELNFASICDPSLPSPTFQWDMAYNPLFTAGSVGTTGMYVEATTDVTQGSPVWIVVANYPDLSAITQQPPPAANFESNGELEIENGTACSNFSRWDFPNPTSAQWVTISVKLPGTITQSSKGAVRFRVYDNGTSGLSDMSPLYIDNCIVNGPWNQDMATASLQLTPADSAVIAPSTTFVPSMSVRLVGNVPYTGSGATITYEIYPLGGQNQLSYVQSQSLTATLSAQCSNTPVIGFPSTNPTVTQIPGEYITMGVVSYPGWDCNSANDTLRNDLVVGFPYDLKPLYFSSPINQRVQDIVGLTQTPSAVIRNIGLNVASNFSVEFLLFQAGNSNPVWNPGPQVVIGSLNSGSEETITSNTSIPSGIISTAGFYTFEMITLWGSDNNHANDTLREQFQFYWKYDIQADSIIAPVNPLSGVYEIPVGATYIPEGKFDNHGADFVANIPIEYQRWKYPINPGDKPLKDIMDTLPELNIQDGERVFQFNTNPGWQKADVPTAAGLYELVMIANDFNSTYPQEDDENPANDTVRLVVSVIPPLSGVYQIGFAQDIPTLYAAADSLQYRGISGNVTFQLTDNNYSVATNLTFTQFKVYKAGANNSYTPSWTGAKAVFTPAPNHTPTITLSNGAEIALVDTTDYLGFDGNTAGTPANRALTIIQTVGNVPAFFLTHGASHNLISDCNITTPTTSGNTAQKQQQNTIGIWEQNTYPNYPFDTLSCSYNTFNNNQITGYRTGIWLHGLAPVFQASYGGYAYLFDTGNVVSNNVIFNCARAGILGTNQSNINVTGNQVYNITNFSTNTCGSMADEDAKVQGIGLGGVRTRCSLTFDGNVAPSPELDSAKGYVVNAQVCNNWVHDLLATSGMGAVGIEVIQDTVWGNTLNAPSSSYTVGIHPDTTHNVAYNNMIWDVNYTVNGTNPTGAATGILWDARGLSNTTEAVPTLNGYFTYEDSILNNTIWMTGGPSQTGAVIDLAMNRSMNMVIYNNIFMNDDSAKNKTIYKFAIQDPLGNLRSDWNLYWFGAQANNFDTLVQEQILDGNGNFRVSRGYSLLSSWKAGTGNDMHSVYGNPQFVSLSSSSPTGIDLDIVPYTSNVWSPAFEAGLALTGTEVKTDIHGTVRGVGGVQYDIGADEFSGLVFANDLDVETIVSPNSTGGAIVTTNPINVVAVVKNIGNTQQLNRNVYLAVDTMLGGNWVQYAQLTLTKVNFGIGQTQTVTFPGFTANNGTTYRMQVTVDPDNNLSNDTATTTQRIFVQTQPTVVSFNSSTVNGRANRDSVFHALSAIGLYYDVLDRSQFTNTLDISYAPWQTVIYSAEDGVGTTPVSYTDGGQSYTYSLSYDEINTLKNFLNSGTPAKRKGLIVAGMNLAYLHDQETNNPAIVDTNFTRHYLYTQYVGQPVSTPYSGTITGVRLENQRKDALQNVTAADVSANGINALRPSPTKIGTPEYAYYYNTHPNLTGVDSAAGITFWGQIGTTNFNTITFGFDWRHLARLGADGISSVLLSALQFMEQHEASPVPIELLTFDAVRNGQNVDLGWATASEEGIVNFNVERSAAGAGSWSAIANGMVAAKGSLSSGASYGAVDVSVAPGTYDYRLAEVYNDGHVEYSNTVEVVMPGTYMLYQNYPNPFNTTTTISYDLQDAGAVHLAVYDGMGNMVKELVAGDQEKEGSHAVTFDATPLPTGYYYYRLDVNGYTQMRHLLLMK